MTDASDPRQPSGTTIDSRGALTRTAVLLIATAFWIYLWSTTLAQWYLVAQALPTRPAPDWGARLWQGVLLYPPLLVLVMVSYRLGYDRLRSAWRVVAHLTLALVFGLLARPTLIVGRALVDGTSFVEAMAAMDGSADFAARVQLWASATLADVVQYLVLQGLIFGGHFYAHYRHEQALRAELAAQYDRARLHALRMQLGPHFLFNTLSAIAGLVRADPHAAETMATRLGDLFRQALAERDDELIPLAQELDYAENYLEIQRLRFADRLRYTIAVDRALSSTPVPPLLLQPILENAVEHGVHGSEGAVLVEIVGARVGHEIHLRIRNGSDGLVVAVHRGSHGLGLRNVRDRIEAAYGNAGSLSFGQTGSREFETLVVLPYAAAPTDAQRAAA
jgi:hypothetical protein